MRKRRYKKIKYFWDFDIELADPFPLIWDSL
jgi:hypothetical protein